MLVRNGDLRSKRIEDENHLGKAMGERRVTHVVYNSVSRIAKRGIKRVGKTNAF